MEYLYEQLEEAILKGEITEDQANDIWYKNQPSYKKMLDD